MGEVYRATDSKLKREVAIKILPDEFARDPERLARLEREAQLLASLNHPNIASIYGIEEFEGSCCLVLELVEGETLAEHQGGEVLPLEESLAIAAPFAGPQILKRWNALLISPKKISQQESRLRKRCGR